MIQVQNRVESTPPKGTFLEFLQQAAREESTLIDGVTCHFMEHSMHTYFMNKWTFAITHVLYKAKGK